MNGDWCEGGRKHRTVTNLLCLLQIYLFLFLFLFSFFKFHPFFLFIQATITFQCCLGMKSHNVSILSISEPSICQYAVNVCVNQLCDQPLSSAHTKKSIPLSFLRAKRISSTLPSLEWSWKLASSFPESLISETRTKIKEMFYHSYSNYMEHAFPLDELLPLSCQGVKMVQTAGILDQLNNYMLWTKKCVEYKVRIMLVYGKIRQIR